MKQIKVYQLTEEAFTTKTYAFCSYEKAAKRGFDFEKDYECVYDCERDDNYSVDDAYEEFNIKRPEDFRGHSLSVSDIVAIDGKMYYCDPFGWMEI